jgi:hypothetical protein
VVAGHDRHGGGQAAAGALAHYCDPLPVDAELFGMLVQPPQSGVDVMNLGRIAVLGSQPVVHGQHRGPAGRYVPGEKSVGQVHAATDHAAAVRVQHCRAGCPALLGVPTHRDLCAVGSGGVIVGHGDVIRHGQGVADLGQDVVLDGAARERVTDWCRVWSAAGAAIGARAWATSGSRVRDMTVLLRRMATEDRWARKLRP